MEIKSKITPSVVQAATAMLSPYVPEISPSGLVAALQSYKVSKAAEEKPYTREEVAKLLGLSLPTVNRLLNNGVLRRIHISQRAVRVTRESVRAMLEGRA